MISTKLRALATAGAFLFSSGLAAAAPAAPQDEGEAQAEDAEAAEEAEEEEVEDDTGRWFAVAGGDVHTGLGEVLRGATVLAKDGRIRRIGYDLWMPEDTEVVDATGLHVYPGLVAVNASSRIPEGTSPFLEEDFREDVHDHLHGSSLHGDSHVEEEDESEVLYVDPGEVDVEHGEHGEARELAPPPAAQRATVLAELGDSYDPFNHHLVLTLASGVTTVGQTKATFKLKRREIDGVVMREDILQTIPYSLSNPRSISGFREKLQRASEYLRKYRRWEEESRTDKDLKEPSRRGVDTTSLQILKGEKRARFNVGQREEILSVARLAQEFGFRPVIFGADEAWTVADELGRAGAAVVVTPRSRSEKDERLVRPGGTSIENAAILHEHGVQVAVIPADTSINLMGIAGRDLMHFPIEAAFAVRGGLPELAALQAITLVPARLLGVEHRVGSLEVGKDCDLIVTDGDLLHYETFVQLTVVEGEVVYDKDEELFFAHIRPREGADSGDAAGEEGTEETVPAEAEAAPAAEEENDG